MDVLSWVFTPALVGSVALLVVPFFAPSLRWSRSLRADMQIAAGLPEGAEKAKWEADIEARAIRLRLYRQTILTGRHLAGVWGVAIYGLLAVVIALVFPPVSPPGAKYPIEWQEYLLPGLGALLLLFALVAVLAGRSATGRDSVSIMGIDRLRRQYRRIKRLSRLRRARRRDDTPAMDVSSLGFFTQVDSLAAFTTAEAKERLLN